MSAVKLDKAVKSIVGVHDNFEENEKGEVTKVTTSVSIEVSLGHGAPVLITKDGVARTHPNDLDLSTKGVGAKIAYLRAIIALVNEIKRLVESGDMDIDISDSDKFVRSIEDEIKSFIDKKESVYQKIRAARNGDESNKVRTFFRSDNGEVVFETTGIKVGGEK